MSIAQVRGGIPRVFRVSIPTAGRMHAPPFYTSYIVARNRGANVIRMYFTEADFDANENYVELLAAAAATPNSDVWEGPCELEKIWFRAITAASTIELVAFQRRG